MGSKDAQQFIGVLFCGKLSGEVSIDGDLPEAHHFCERTCPDVVFLQDLLELRNGDEVCRSPVRIFAGFYIPIVDFRHIHHFSAFHAVRRLLCITERDPANRHFHPL